MNWKLQTTSLKAWRIHSASVELEVGACDLAAVYSLEGVLIFMAEVIIFLTPMSIAKILDRFGLRYAANWTTSLPCNFHRHNVAPSISGQ